MIGKLRHISGRFLCLLGIHKIVTLEVNYGGDGSDGAVVYYDRCKRTGCDWKTPLRYHSR